MVDRMKFLALLLLLATPAEATYSPFRALSSGTDSVAVGGSAVLPTGAGTETTLLNIKTGTDKIPASPAQDRTTAAAPFACRQSDGAAFFDPRLITVDGTKTTAATMPAGGAGAIGWISGILQQLVAGINVTILAGTNAIGKLAANAGVNIGTVDVASEIPGTGATNLGKAEDAVPASGDTGVSILGVRTDPTTTSPVSANGDYTQLALDYVGAVPLAVHPGRFSCFVPITATVTTQCQAAPAAGLRAYVTSLQCSNGAATVQGIDVVYGTGTNCATGITALTHKYQMGTNQTTTSPFEISAYFGPASPLVPAAANAICVRPTAATAFGCTITGFIAP
jgi:hypothetical protein